MSELSSWFGYNRLSFNLKKSKYMIFGTDSQVNKIGDITVTIGNESLERVYIYKYLEILLDPKLSFSYHVEYIKKKTFRRSNCWVESERSWK